MNISKPNDNRIAVKTLLKHSTLPSYETVKSTDRHYSKRIIEPFERDMNALQGIEWIYLNKGGIPLTDEQLNEMAYDTFIGSVIEIQWISYPQETVETARKKAIQKRKQIEKSKK